LNPGENTDIAKEETVLGKLMGADYLVSGLVSALGSRIRSSHPIGLVGQDVMPAGLFNDLRKAIPAGLLVDNDLLRKVARNKSPWERGCIRRAQAMADMGCNRMLEKVKPGIREFELAAELELTLRLEGARDNFNLLAASGHNQAIRLPTNKKLEAGDIVIAEISPECDGYFAQLCRTIVLGEPSEVLLEKYGLLKRCFEAGLQAAKPGALAEDVALAINRITFDAGYEVFSNPPYMRSRGHGLGQGSNFPGEFSEGNKTLLEEGMTFIIHPNQYLPETGYLMLGETCEISEDGARSFSSLERKLFVVDDL
jgi:Xaa-Pro aminopeptidase